MTSTLHRLCPADNSSVDMFSCVIVNSPDNRLNLQSFSHRLRKFRSVIDSLSLQKTSKRASNGVQLTGLMLPDCSFFHSFKILLDITSETPDLFNCVTPARIATYPVNPPYPLDMAGPLLTGKAPVGRTKTPMGGVVINTVPLRCWVTVKRLKMSLWIRSRPHTGTHTQWYRDSHTQMHAHSHSLRCIHSRFDVFFFSLEDSCVSAGGALSLFNHGIPLLFIANQSISECKTWNLGRRKYRIKTFRRLNFLETLKQISQHLKVILCFHMR